MQWPFEIVIQLHSMFVQLLYRPLVRLPGCRNVVDVLEHLSVVLFHARAIIPMQGWRPPPPTPTRLLFTQFLIRSLPYLELLPKAFE